MNETTNKATDYILLSANAAHNPHRNRSIFCSSILRLQFDLYKSCTFYVFCDDGASMCVCVWTQMWIKLKMYSSEQTAAGKECFLFVGAFFFTSLSSCRYETCGAFDTDFIFHASQTHRIN